MEGKIVFLNVLFLSEKTPFFVKMPFIAPTSPLYAFPFFTASLTPSGNAFAFEVKRLFVSRRTPLRFSPNAFAF